MPLWGTQQVANGVFKPKFGFPKYMGIPNILPGANGANTFGVTANGNKDGASTFGGNPPTHAGWVNFVLGRGYVNSVLAITAAGNNVANLSYAVPFGGNGSGANLQVTSVNGNGSIGNVLTVAVRAQGAGYNSAPTLAFAPLAGGPASAANANVTLTMGGRTGRYQVESIVAMGSITGTDPNANNFYANNF